MTLEKVEVPRLTKAYMKALEKVFEATIDNKLPFQSKAKVYRVLEIAGYIQPFTDTISGVVIKGYQLTHPGMLAYCMNAKEDE